MINRYLNLRDTIKTGSVLVILGPRRSGKTTLLKTISDSGDPKSIVAYKGDELSVQENFSTLDSSKLAQQLGTASTLVIDEAQMIPNIGKSLKLLVDTQPELKVVVTGSSAFELAGQLGEPLTGRKNTKYLLPVSVYELVSGSTTPELTLDKRLPSLLVYGMYPSVVTEDNLEEKSQSLRELVDSYLLKDILTFQEVKGSSTLRGLLRLIAYQVGSEVSLSELGSALGIDRKTVERYLDLLEKTFVVFRLGGYSRNLRSEVTKMSKYYFYDNGIRNAIINNFNPLDIRDDVGQLWENFAVSERQKKRLYYGPSANQYFWRTWKGSEVDLVEERSGKLFGYEFKWSTKKQPKAPLEWKDTYSNSSWEVVTPDDLYDFTKPDQ